MDTHSYVGGDCKFLRWDSIFFFQAWRAVVQLLRSWPGRWPHTTGAPVTTTGMHVCLTASERERESYKTEGQGTEPETVTQDRRGGGADGE